MPLIDAGSILSFLLMGNGTRETATSFIRSRLISISPLEIKVGVDLASAFRFLAMLDPAPEYELPPEILLFPLPLPRPDSMTEVEPITDSTVATVLTELVPVAEVLPLLLLVLLLVPNTESELTTIVSVKLDVVNFAIASLDKSSLLLPE